MPPAEMLPPLHVTTAPVRPRRQAECRDGLTLLTGLGQFKGSSGVIQRERSMLLILLYPRAARDGSAKIEQIRTIYEQRFQQESVLRADDPLPRCVSF